MKTGAIAIVGAAETTDLGVVPGMAEIQLHADAALNAMRDAGLKPSDIDGDGLRLGSRGGNAIDVRCFQARVAHGI